VRVWSLRDFGPSKPASTGDGSDSAVFIKFAKPLGKKAGIGFLAGYETSQMTLIPDNGSAPIRFRTQYLPQVGFGLHWEPNEHWLLGTRVLTNNDTETREDAKGTHTGDLNKIESRAGVAFTPWKGTIVDAGIVRLDRWDGVANTENHDFYPTLGIEQAIVPKVMWVRGGLDETTWALGFSAKPTPFKLDVALLQNIAESRTQDTFGHRNTSVIATLNFDYESVLKKPAKH
jgi:hypothetical protein